MGYKIAVVAAVNDQTVLAKNLAASPILSGGNVEFIIERGHHSASCAYNAALDKIDAEIVIFAHQDVYIPRGWEKKLYRAISQLEAAGKNWGVLGVVGLGVFGELAGRVWSTGLGREVIGQIREPAPVQSLDELLLVLNAKMSLRFDENLPGFHLYGTDIVQEALRAGYAAYAIDAPVIHNSLPVRRLGKAYARAYHYMRRKWIDRLPSDTLCCKITRTGWPLFKARYPDYAKRFVKSMLAQRRGDTFRREDPRKLAQQLEYE